MITIKTANGCAWRAFYIYLGQRKVMHMGIDPEWRRPQFFGSIGYEKLFFNRFVPMFQWRIRLPRWINRFVTDGRIAKMRRDARRVQS